MQKTMTMTLAATLAISVLAGITAASADDITDGRFEKETKAQLKELKIPESDVKSMKIVQLRKRSERSGPEILGAESWIRLNSCTGHLIVVMNRVAFTLDIYTRGDCSLAGLKNY